MGKTDLKIITSKRFLPLFLTQFLGAMNDNVFKNAIALLILYRLSTENGPLLITVAGGLFILPFFLFSGLAGQIADKYEKSRLIQIIKLAEILIMLAGVFGLFSGHALFLLFILFLMGLQSTFFGPIKYSILPDILNENELLEANALITAATFLAILIGTILGGFLILKPNGLIIISILITGLAFIGWWASRYIPKVKAANPEMIITKNIFAQITQTIRYTYINKNIFMTIVVISWFWLMGATFISQFPNFAKLTLHANEDIVTLFLALFSVGVGIGSLICNKLLKGEISTKHVPYGSIGMSVVIIDLFFACQAFASYQLHVTIANGDYIGISDFIMTFHGFRIVMDLLIFAIAAGIFIVPLYTLLQTKSPTTQRSQIIAANNILNAAFMVSGAIVTMIILSFQWSIPDIFLSLAIVNIFVSVYLFRQNTQGSSS